MAEGGTTDKIPGPLLYGVAAVLVVISVLWPLVGSSPKADPLHTSNTSYQHAFIVLDGDRTLVALVLSDDSKPVATLDSRTGERVAMGTLCPPTTQGRITVHQPQNQWLWVSCGPSDFVLLDLITATPTLTASEVTTKNPELAAGFRLDHRSVSHDVDAPTHELMVKLHDGRTAWIDMQGGLAFAPSPGEPWQPGYFCWPEHTCSTERKECLGLGPSPSGQGMVLTSNRIHGERQRPGETLAEWPAGLLRPGFVKQPTNRCAFEREGGYLLLHDSAAFEPKEALLSLVDRDGTLHWTRRTAELGAAEGYEPRRAELVGDEVLIFSTNESHRKHLTATWLDLKTGEVRSAQQLFGSP